MYQSIATIYSKSIGPVAKRLRELDPRVVCKRRRKGTKKGRRRLGGSGGLRVQIRCASDADEPIGFANSDGDLPMRETEQCWYVPSYHTVREDTWGNRDWVLRLSLSTGFERSVTAVVDCVILQSSGIQ